MGYRDTISKLGFALVFIYLVFDIKLGGIFQYFDSSYFKLLASFVLIYFGLSTRRDPEPSLSPTSLISVIMGVFGKQFNSESGYDFYYFSPSKVSNSLEYSSIISGILGLKLLVSTYCVDFSWYLKTISIMGISEAVCLLLIFLDFYIFFQIFAKLRLHDFLYQVYHLQNSGGAWTSMYICQIQSIGYVLSLVVYVIEFLESISHEFLDILFFSWDSIYHKLGFVFAAQKKLQLFVSETKLAFKLIVSETIKSVSLVISTLKIYKFSTEYSSVSRAKLITQQYKIQKYCNTNLLDLNFLIIKKLLINNKAFKKNFSASVRFSDFKKLFSHDIFGSGNSYLFSNSLVPVLRC